MSSTDITRRAAVRPCTCRGCDGDIEPGEDCIYTYSPRNRGQHIYFCLSCGRLIGKLAKPLKRVLKGEKDG
jgi:hypothetical protein